MANMNFGVNILPKANNTYTLGNSDYKWNIFANTLNGISLTNIITDIQINGTSIISNNIANFPLASTTDFGLVKIGNGLLINSNTNRIEISAASSTKIKEGTDYNYPIVPVRQHESVFYGLAKAAGDSTQSASSNAVGTYTDSAKTAIQNMLGITTMTGATSSVAGTSGLVPAPATTDVDKFLAGDGTYKSGGLPMVILSYGNSTWQDFLDAYNNNVIVYCRASSNSNPASGSQTRMAFMAYVSDASNPTSVEFQYYRSMNAHSDSQMGDQVYIYKLTNQSTWSVTVRDASIKSITGNGIDVNWNSNTVTLTNQADLRQWELIREDTLTNTTQADMEITVDNDGNAFELTDIALWVALQSDSENISTWGDYGRTRYIYGTGSGDYDDTLFNTITVNAGTSAKIAYAYVEQDGNLVRKMAMNNTTSGNTGTLIQYATNNFSSQIAPMVLTNSTRYYNKIIFKQILGTLKFRIYGKRKAT